MEEHVVNSIIGHGSRFTGDIEVDGLVRVDGDFQGSIRTSGKVLVGSTGRLDCVVDARTVVVGGVFKGTIYAGEKVVLLPNAVVMASIFSPRLIAEEGVILEGSIMVTGVQDFDAADDPGYEVNLREGRLFRRQHGLRRAAVEKKTVRQESRP